MADKDDPKKKEAVALKYERDRDPAPRVVAKGKGTIAEQILKVAEEHGITVREDAELVDILGKLDLDSIIPLEAYAAVAEILSFIYRTNDKAKKGARL